MTLKSISVVIDPTRLVTGRNRDSQTPGLPGDGVFYRLPADVVHRMFPESVGCDVFYGDHRSVAYCATIVGYWELGVLAVVLDVRKGDSGVRVRPPTVARPSILVLAFPNEEARDAFSAQRDSRGCTCWAVECGED